MKKNNDIIKKLRTNILKLSHKAKSSHIGSCVSIAILSNNESKNINEIIL